MKTYIMLIGGSVVAPQLTHEFSDICDSLAMDKAERLIQSIHSDKYWRYDLFEKESERHVVHFTSMISVNVKRYSPTLEIKVEEQK